MQRRRQSDPATNALVKASSANRLTARRKCTVSQPQWAVLACALAGCSSPSDPTPVDATWSSKPTTHTDAGSNVDAAIPDDVPEPVCTLTGAPSSTPGDVLVYSDEFDGTSVDTKKWNVGSGKRGPFHRRQPCHPRTRRS